MKKVHVLPHIITAFGLASGLFVIFRSVTLPEWTYHHLFVSALLLLLAGFADLIDGAVARAMRAESEFGFHFDSLADAVSFGVAPTVLTLRTLGIEPRSFLSFLTYFGALLFSIGGILRLVRFNVQSKVAQGDPELILSQKKHFTGLPIPAAALAVVSLNLLFSSKWCPHFLETSLTLRGVILSLAMIVLGYFMVSRWKFPSAKALNFRVARTELVLLAVIVAIVTLYGALYFFPLVLGLMMWGYIFVAWTLSILRLLAGKKSKTLAAFEPDDDDDLD